MSKPIPKQPVKVSKKKKTLPVEIDWGKGMKDRLRYISPGEEAMIRRNRSTDAERYYGGIRAYPDPDDTANTSTGNWQGAPGSGTTSPGAGGTTGGGSDSGTISGAGSAPSAPSAGAASATTESRSPVSSSSAATPSYSGGMGGGDTESQFRQVEDSYRGGIGSITSGSISSIQTPQTTTPTYESSAARNVAIAAGAGPLTSQAGSYYGPKGINSLNTDARLAAARSVGWSSPTVPRTPGDAAMLGRMMMAESQSIQNPQGGIRTEGLHGVADVVRNRVLSEKFPDNAVDVMRQPNQFSPLNANDGSFYRTPEDYSATAIAESVLSGETPPVVGNSLNYANLDTVRNMGGYSSAATKAQFGNMDVNRVIADARNPGQISHSFGTIGNQSDVDFSSYSPEYKLAATEESLKVPTVSVATAPGGILGLTGSEDGEYSDSEIPDSGVRRSVPGGPPPSSVFADDPRLGLPTGSYPAARPESVFAQDPRLVLSQSGYPAAPKFKIGTEPQGPQGFTGLPSVPTPDSEGISQITGETSAPTGYMKSIQDAMTSLSGTLGSLTPQSPEEAAERAKIAASIRFAMSPAGKALGADKIASQKFNEAFPNSASSGINALKSGIQSGAVASLSALGTMQRAGLGGVGALTNAADAERASDTINKAEGKKISGRLPGGPETRVGSFNDTIVKISDPSAGASVVSAPEYSLSEVFKEGSPEAQQNAAAFEQAMSEQDYNDYVRSQNAVAARVLTPDQYAKPGVNIPDIRYPTIDGVPVQPDQISSLDMEKMRARHRGEPAVLTDDERRAINVGGTAARFIAGTGPAKIATRLADKVVSKFYGETPIHGLADPKDVMRDYAGRPSWEKEQIQALADQSNQRLAAIGGDSYVGPRGDTQRDYKYDTTGVRTWSGDVPWTGGRGGDSRSPISQQSADWSRGVGIPNPGDPEYASYMYWLNSSGSNRDAWA